jgi:hypothetical protein
MPLPTLRINRLNNIFSHSVDEGSWLYSTFKFVVSIPYFAGTFGTRFGAGFNPRPPFMAASFTL